MDPISVEGKKLLLWRADHTVSSPFFPEKKEEEKFRGINLFSAAGGILYVFEKGFSLREKERNSVGSRNVHISC